MIRAKADYERNRKLLADKVISTADFETSEANYNVAKQEVEAARANVRAAQFNIQARRRVCAMPAKTFAKQRSIRRQRNGFEAER